MGCENPRFVHRIDVIPTIICYRCYTYLWELKGLSVDREVSERRRNTRLLRIMILLVVGLLFINNRSYPSILPKRRSSFRFIPSVRPFNYSEIVSPVSSTLFIKSFYQFGSIPFPRTRDWVVPEN